MRGIMFGAEADSIKKQVPELPSKDALHFQRDADAITRLTVRGIIAYGDANRARKRLVKMIEATLREWKGDR